MVLAGHSGTVMCCTVSEDGLFVVSGGADSTGMRARATAATPLQQQ
jgi:hypothetical protein